MILVSYYIAMGLCKYTMVCVEIASNCYHPLYFKLPGRYNGAGKGLKNVMSESRLVKYGGDFSLHYNENWKYWSMSDHFHNEHEIIYVVKGKIEITINGKTYLADSNSLVLINNLEPHYYTILEYPYFRHVLVFKQSCLSILANEPVLASLFNYRPKSFNHVVKLTDEQAPAVNELFAKMHTEFGESKPFWEKYIKMLLSQLVVYLYRISEKSFPLSNLNQSVYKTVIISIQNYLDEHFMEEINLKDMAARFHTNMYYLCHLFKEITGTTFKNHLIQRRVSYAKDLLAYTGKDISEIAVETGFSSVNHFIRTFKKLVETTPYQYRKSFRKSQEKAAQDKELLNQGLQA